MYYNGIHFEFYLRQNVLFRSRRGGWKPIDERDPDGVVWNQAGFQSTKGIMKLGAKIVVSAIGAIVLTSFVGLVISRNVIRKQGIDLTRETMRLTLIEAENAREAMSALNQKNVFDRTKLVTEARQADDLRTTPLYDTIPVVAAWKSIQKAAEKQNYHFRVYKRQPRNPKNEPASEEAKILDYLEQSKATDYFLEDTANNQLIYARPIRLTTDCLSCHGDPKTSATGDGKDIVGFTMENWKEGELHGVFQLKASLEPVNAMVRTSFLHTVAWVLPLVLVIGVGFYGFSERSIVRPLCRAIEQIGLASHQTSSAAGEISHASTTLAQSSSEQAASLEETSASLEEMATTGQRNAENAEHAKTLAQQSRVSAEKAAEDIATMDHSMQAVAASSGQLNAAMDKIQSSSMAITQIMKTVDEIAFQTNILSLNAAVEAARAGESGAGFAVVADEVRALARRSAEAAGETAAMIKEAVDSSQQGKVVTEKVSGDLAQMNKMARQVDERLQEIVAQVRKVDTVIAEIAEAFQEQSRGVAMVNKAIEQMDKTTQMNAASSEEAASASEQLYAQSATLKEAIHEMSKLMSGSPLPAGETRLDVLPPPKTDPFEMPGRGRPGVRAPHDTRLS